MADMKIKQRKKSVSIKDFKVDKKTFFRLLDYIKPHRLKLILIIICILVTALVTVYMSLFLGIVIDEYIIPMLSQDKPNFMPLLNAMIRYAVILCISLIASFGSCILSARLSQSIIRDVRDEMFQKMQNYPISFFDKNKYGDLMSHYTNDVDTLREFFSHTLAQVINALISITFVFVSMILLSINLTIIVLIGIFLLLKYSSFIAAKSGKNFMKAQETVGDLNAFVEEMINGAKEVKTFCYEEENKKHFNDKNEIWRENSTKANTFASILMPSLFGFGNILYVIVAIIGAYAAIAAFPNFSLRGTNVITVGIIAAFLTLVKSFVRPISETSAEMNIIMMALAGAKRIFEFLDEPFEVDDGKIELKKESVQGSIVFKDVYFAYEDEKYVLKNINIYAKPGQKIALVGHTGAGKTTITNLVNRFYDINKGSITYDDVDIKEYTKKSLRNSLSVVLQDVNLFTGTVLDNIRYGNIEASDEDCIKAAKMVRAHDFIEMLPDGYNTLITGGGSSLSQGQRQLISIARALIADPAVLILDEATSSIDTRTEKLISKGMDVLMEGRTVFVIAHRLSTIRNAKAIMVLENGEIIERGDHEYLMEQKGKYYQLYTGAVTLE